MSDPNGTMLPGAAEINAFIERNWFHLDHGWIDFGANQIGDAAEREDHKDAEDAASNLIREMASQYNTAVVAAGHYAAVLAEHMAQAADWSAPRPEIDVQAELLGIFARAYVFGLDGVEGCARELATVSQAPDTTRSLAASLARSMDLVKQVRDSLQHIEERVQGEAKDRPIPSSVLILGNYSNAGFMMTTADGVVATIVVSEPALAGVRSQIIAIDRSLVWRRAGPACPGCGGSFRPHVLGPAPTQLPAAMGVEWHCDRCGLRQQVGRQR